MLILWNMSTVRRSRLTAAAALILLGVCCALWASCVSYRPAAEARGGNPWTPPEASAWPERERAGIERLHELTGDVVWRARPAAGVDPDELDDRMRSLIEGSTHRIVHSGLHGQGLLRIIDDADMETLRSRRSEFSRMMDDFLVGFDYNAYFLSSHREDGRPGTPERDVTRSLVEVRAPARRETDDVEWRPRDKNPLLRRGVELRVPVEAPDDAKGLIVRFNSLMGNEHERRTVKALEDRGWVVVEINTQTHVRTPREEAIEQAMERRREVASKLVEARLTTHDGDEPEEGSEEREEGLPDSLARLVAEAFVMDTVHAAYEQAAEEVPLPRRGFALEELGGPKATGRAIAAAIDDLVAENAYAAEAVLEYIDAHRPDLAELPTVLMGFSAGSLVVSTAAARLGGRIDGAVLIGGGADLFEVSQRTSLEGYRLAVLDDEDQSVGWRALGEVHAEYLETTRLDPVRIGGALHGMPTLLVHATMDRIVPAATGRRMAEALGMPDRVRVRGGHLAMFWLLPRMVDRIDRWLDANVLRGDAAEAADAT